MTANPTLLLVEDEPGARRLFEEAVDECAVADLEVATDGREALDVLPTRDGEPSELPDLVVLDLDLPEVHGLDVLRELKAENSPAQRIPVLVLSEATDQDVVDEAYEAGANVFLPKPGDYAELLALIRVLGDFWLTRANLPSG